MASSVIPQVPDVDIDPNGVFKYILIKLTCPNSGGQLEEKNIVRGYASCSYHSDINDKVTEELQDLKSSKVIRDWRTKVLGGGRINHDCSSKVIKVYGYSQGYGKADHEVTVELLKQKYTGYNSISWSDEGY
ncbi:Ocnus domain containing protein [Asbolus verrucosus]|uniref:Sex-regulated protein janus-A n=1 Tax=Asbolus verrucosus TaxID=1661398 RepID=A0A482WAF7_ASBVE|nr:Ocnus domain containing protein [Asbolus verrucosus]